MCDVDKFTISAIRPVAALVHVVPGFQIGDDFLDRPASDAAPRIVGDVGREPALQRISLQRTGAIVPAKRILRRVAHAAMGEPFGQIGAAIPFRALVGIIGRNSPGVKNSLSHDQHRAADVERERQLVRLDGIVAPPGRVSR